MRPCFPQVVVPPVKIFGPTPPSHRGPVLDVRPLLGTAPGPRDEGEPSAPEAEAVLVGVTPALGRVLLFPHKQPHAGAACVALPKVVLRAELSLSLVST